MQAPTFHNTSVTGAPSSSELRIGDKDDSYSSSTFNFYPMKESKKGVSSTIKHGDEINGPPNPLDVVKHEDFPKLHALSVNVDRWEKDITRYTGQRWCSQQEGYVSIPEPALFAKGIIRDLQCSLEAQEDAVAHVPVLRRGIKPSADLAIDRCSMFLCQECSDIFDYMSRLLVYNRVQIAKQSWQYDKDLNVMCHALSPFDEYELDQSAFLAPFFSDFWFAEFGDEQGSNEHFR